MWDSTTLGSPSLSLLLERASDSVLQTLPLLAQERLLLLQALLQLHRHGPPSEQHHLFLSLSHPLEHQCLALWESQASSQDLWVLQYHSPPSKELLYAVQGLALVWKNNPDIPTESLQRGPPLVSALLHLWEHWALPAQQQRLSVELRSSWGEAEGEEGETTKSLRNWLSIRQWSWKIWEAALQSHSTLAPLPWQQWFRHALPMWHQVDFPGGPDLPGSPRISQFVGTAGNEGCVEARLHSTAAPHSSRGSSRPPLRLEHVPPMVGVEDRSGVGTSRTPRLPRDARRDSRRSVRREASRQLVTWWRSLLTDTLPLSTDKWAVQLRPSPPPLCCSPVARLSHGVQNCYSHRNCRHSSGE